MQDTWVWFLDWEDPLEKKQLPSPVELPAEIHGQRDLADDSRGARKELDPTERLSLTLWNPKEWQPKSNVSVFEVKPPEN